MSTLLTRDEFRESCLKRDKQQCVVCGKKDNLAVHHIVERRLFSDSGYYMDNGATLCPECHIAAEKTDISTDEIRKACGITKVVLPEHLYPDYEYTKWGDIQLGNGQRIKGELFFDESVQKIIAGHLHRYSKYVKYPRSFHLPWSAGKTDDDKTIPSYKQFENQQVVVTVKMDGENTTGYSDGYIHARSLDSQNHNSRNWTKQYLSSRLFELPSGWRLCGENLYAKHSIHYKYLQSYFYLFSIWNDKNECLSWTDTEEWAALLDIPVVPVLYQGLFNQQLIEKLYAPTFDENECEGYVLRLADKFSYGNFRKSLAKYVRACHVSTNTHWIKQKIQPNLLK